VNYVLVGLILFLLATLPSAGISGGGLEWSLANGAGYVACLLLMLVCVYSARGMPQGPGYLWHRDVGFAVVLATLMHVLLLLADPAVWAYVLPGAPAYMWAGVLACLPLLGVSVGAVRRARRRWPAYARVFRNAHLAWTWLALVLVAWHVVGAGAYLRDTFARSLVLVALLGLPLAAQVAGSRLRPRHQEPLPRRLTLGSAALLLLCFVLVRTP
jgi:hypothetical protein